MDTPSDLSRLKIERPSGGMPLPRKSRRGWLIGAGVALLLGGLVAARMATAPVAVETVAVAEAWPYQGVTELNATGYVVAQRKAAVASKATGRLEWLGVREGSVVKAGDVVARLESRDVEAQAQQAEANIAVARANLGQADAEVHDAELALQRARELRARNFVAQAAVDTAEARYLKARAASGSARAALLAAEANARAARVAVEQTLIRAPFDGVVLTKSANVGDVITPFSSAMDSKGAVVTMADMDTLEVEADVSESSLSKIHVGQPCEIQLDAFPDRRFRGEVVRFVPTVDRAKASVLTKVRFLDPDPRVLPEMSAKVAFLSRALSPADRKPRTAVHHDALAEGGKAVFRVEDGVAHRVPVRTGARIGEQVEVGGLKPGEKVVLKPAPNLQDGAAVTVGGK
ncbi:MAG: efflux RND transporter periplasmic adaptor subunit [Zoogloea sp.]|nr:efflux RND transporter periplasmic adaptor subunit [Zoogloea sp.]